MRRRYNQRRAQALYGGGRWGGGMNGLNGMQNMYGMGGHPVQSMFGMGGNMGGYGNQQYGIPQYGYPQSDGYPQQNNPQQYWSPQHNYAIPYAQGFGMSNTGYGKPQYYSYAYAWPPIGGYTFWRGDRDPDDKSNDWPKAVTLSTESSAGEGSKAFAPDKAKARKPNTSTDRSGKLIGRSGHAPTPAKAAASKDDRRDPSQMSGAEELSEGRQKRGE